MTSGLPLVNHIVRSVAARIPAHVDRGDLISAGMIALVLSAKRFDPERGIPFAHFAAFRIRGAVIDELRAMDWATRTVRGRARAAEDAADQLSTTLGRTPTTRDIAGAMGISVADLGEVNANANQAGLLSLQHVGFLGADMVPETTWVRRACSSSARRPGICAMPSANCPTACAWLWSRTTSTNG